MKEKANTASKDIIAQAQQGAMQYILIALGQATPEEFVEDFGPVGEALLESLRQKHLVSILDGKLYLSEEGFKALKAAA